MERKLKRKSQWSTAIKGKYYPHDLSKYTGNPKRITYRSLWERRFMLYCDKSNQIVEWSSEEIAIPYIYDGKNRMYYPDFLITTHDDRTIIIEIKPAYQTKYKQNVAKWNSATQYAEARGMEFSVLTEKELF